MRDLPWWLRVWLNRRASAFVHWYLQRINDRADDR